MSGEFEVVAGRAYVHSAAIRHICTVLNRAENKESKLCVCVLYRCTMHLDINALQLPTDALIY
jgi:hypothetical protein